MPLCAVATRMRGYQQLLLWPLACASSIGSFLEPNRKEIEGVLPVLEEADR